ncbi:Adaptive-response sensory-kinase SasA [Sporomusa carbonis]|uniref:HAMP domain-containing sensor histidine kinase n=1 Tax=Sporomusa carbonis TaxID=3076075 RepID=UPI003A6F9DD3
MKTSIREKLFITLSGLVLFFVLMSLGLTRLGLENFYIWQKKNLLLTSSQAVDELYTGNPEGISLELERIGNTLGAGLIILSREGYIKYSSFSPMINQKLIDRPPRTFSPNGSPDTARPLPPPPNPPHIVKNTEVIDSQTVLKLLQDQDLKIDFLFLEHQLKTGDILIIRQPLAPVSESATVAAQFMVFTGILSILAGCIWAFFFAKKFTRPILELNRIAQSMSQLDFSQKCTIDRSDELGELGKSINHLSSQLDSAITELNQKNQQLLADVEKERKLDKMRKDFVSNVSHELKTPLALILGYAEGLKENIARDEDSRSYYCSVIMDEAEKMDKLVKDLLNLSQLESGMFELNKSDFNLSLLLNDIVLKYRTILAEKGITLDLDIDTDCLVNGDVLRIEQVLLNIFTNAIDHTEGAKTIKILTKDCEDHIRVFVVNSGRPIPEESLEKIWTSFYKVDTARTRKNGGYGLGLSIVRAIQEQHGNSFGAENTGDGVMFWVDLNKA